MCILTVWKLRKYTTDTVTIFRVCGWSWMILNRLRNLSASIFVFSLKPVNDQKTESNKDMLASGLMQITSFGCMFWICVPAIELKLSFFFFLLLLDFILVDCLQLNHCCIYYNMWAWEGQSQLSELCMQSFQPRADTPEEQKSNHV